MANTGLRPYILSLVALTFFIWFLVSFVGTFLVSTNPTSEALGSQYGMNNAITSMNKSVYSFNGIAETVKVIANSSQPSATDYLFLIFRGAFDIPFAFLSFGWNSLTAITNVAFAFVGINGALGNVLAIGIGAIVSGLTITLIFLIIKSVRSGESER